MQTDAPFELLAVLGFVFFAQSYFARVGLSMLVVLLCQFPYFLIDCCYPKRIFIQNSQAAFIRHNISFPYTDVQMYRATLRGHDKEDAAAQKLLSRQEDYLHSLRHMPHSALQKR